MLATKTWHRAQGGFVVALAVAIGAGVAAWFLVSRSVKDSTSPVPLATQPARPAAQPLLLDSRGLRALAGSEGGAIYWAGARPGTTYEVTRDPRGYVFVRYLAKTARPATPPSAQLTVATYPQADAFARLTAASRRAGSVAVELARGGLAVYAEARPTNVYLAYPGSHEQIEVYDPSAGEALRLVRSGRVARVSGEAQPPTAAGPQGLSAARLRAHVALGDKPVFWAGARRATVYELTETGDGRVYVRYLHARRQVGSSLPSFLTVASYPDHDAFRHVDAASRRSGAVRLVLAGGGVAAYDSAHPTSVYLAYPGKHVQVEVYDPSAVEAQRLVKDGLIRPIG